MVSATDFGTCLQSLMGCCNYLRFLCVKAALIVIGKDIVKTTAKFRLPLADQYEHLRLCATP